MDIFGPIFQFIQTLINSQILNIPLQNTLSIVYVILNLILQIFGLISGGGIPTGTTGF